ncbi:MAG: thioredoxin [Actinomycetota bacterium]
MSLVFEATDDNFDIEVVRHESLVLVEFWAPWCGPCRALSPILDEIAAEYSDKLKVVKVNTDENFRTASQYGITSLPTMKVYFQGQVIKSIIGAKPKPALLRELDLT